MFNSSDHRYFIKYFNTFLNPSMRKSYTSNCTYKYSSNYSKKDICDLISQLKSLEVENCLSMEYTRVNENISDLFQELSIYKKYLIKFPKCSELINRFIDQKESEIHLLSYELKALRNLLEAE